MQITTEADKSQALEAGSPFDDLIHRLRSIRQESLTDDRGSRTGVLAGQLVLLLEDVKRRGVPPGRKRLTGFLKIAAHDFTFNIRDVSRKAA